MAPDEANPDSPDPVRRSAADLVSAFGHPAYGLIDAYRSLMQFGMSLGRADNAPNAVGFDFSSGPVEDPVFGVRVETRIERADIADMTRDFELQMAGGSAWWSLLDRRGREAEMLKMRTRKQPGSALALMGDFPREVLTDQGLRVEGLGPAVAVYRWQTPGVVHAVCFEDATTRLLAGTFGFDTGDLSELFQHIGRIDNRPDVLARYDAETEARRAELRRSHR